jgi:predicted ATPase
VAIHDATAGNPFFVDEFLRSLLADGVLDFDASGPLRIPAGVRSVVRQRLGILPRVDVEVLDVAAVIGRTFDIATIAAATERSTGDVLRSLTAALRHGVVEQHSGRLAEFRFRHAVIREVVYEELAPERRLAIHRRVGCALEARSRSDPDRYAAELAHHFLMAAPLADDARFIDYATQAARRALDRMAYEEAIALYQWALDPTVA